MRTDKSQDFRFRMNSDGPHPYLQEDIEDKRQKKQGKKMTVITIIIPCLFGIIIFWGYQDLKKGFSNLRDTDVIVSRELSQALDSKFSSISIQVAKLEESLGTIQSNFEKLEAAFNKKVMPLNEIYLVFEKTTTALKDNLRDTGKAIDQLKASKSDKSDVTAAVNNIEKKVSPVYQHLKNMEAEIKALDENLTQELAELSGTIYKVKNELKQFDTIQKELNKFSALKNDISTIASKQSKQIDPKTLDKALQDQQKRISKDLNKLNATLKESSSRIKALEGHVQELLKFKAISEIKKRLEPKTSTSPSKKESTASQLKKQKPTAKPPAETAPQPAAPKPGKILEETLR